MMKVLSEWRNKERSAQVVVSDEGIYFVKMYVSDNMVEMRSMKEHSEYYANDCAENWITGIIK